MSASLLEIIACVSLVLAHIPFAFPKLNIPFVYIGKLSFPIYAFLISKEYMEKKSFTKIFIRLIVLALIAQVPACFLIIGNFTLRFFNIFFTFAVGLLCIRIYDKISNKYISSFIIIILAITAEILGFDYGLIGILILVTFYIFDSNKTKMVLTECALFFILYLEKSFHFKETYDNLKYILIQLIFSILSLIFITLYNGKKRKNTKLFKIILYSIYPVQLVTLLLIKNLII